MIAWGTYLIPSYLRRNISIQVNERIVEVPLLFHLVTIKPGMQVLEFGCNESKVSIQLASLGCQVVGVDLEEYLLQHPNFSFVRGDFLNMDFPVNSFDLITAVSALEHTGLDYYSGQVYDRADYLIVGKIFELLKKGGQFFLTVPFGVEQIFPPYYRVYGEDIYDLLSRFEMKQEHFFSNINGRDWLRIDKKTALTLQNSAGAVKCVGVFLCSKAVGGHLAKDG